MSFVEPLFFVFIVPVLVAVALTGGRVRIALLVIAAYAFYAAAFPPYVLILVAGTLFDFWVAERIYRSKRHSGLWMALTVATNIGILAGFKYVGLFVESWNELVPTGFHLTDPKLRLPLGISFFTFQSLSYTIDIYRRQIRPTKSLLEFALFISYFPHLVAGPIIRARDFLPQVATMRPLDPQMTWLGMGLILMGYFKKTVVGDNAGTLVDPIFADPTLVGGAATWIGALFFSLQIYADFSGYTDVATGVSLILGVRLKENFHWPYLSHSIREFWRRWHMSLSYFLRDYLYVSLGGDRGSRWQTARNVLVVWFLGGLWHGASWHFVAWGLYHGTLVSFGRILYASRWCSALWNLLPRVVQVLFTFLLVTFGWVLFRAEKLSIAWTMWRQMLTPWDGRWTLGLAPYSGLPIVLFGLAAAAHVLSYRLWGKRPQETFLVDLPVWTRPLVFGTCAALIAVFAGEARRFIYFDF